MANDSDFGNNIMAALALSTLYHLDFTAVVT